MADVAPVNIWPELDGSAAVRAANALFQRFSSDQTFRVTTAIGSGTHWLVGSSSGMCGLQPYPGSSSRMALLGADDVLVQLAIDAADTPFFYHADAWLGNDGSGNAILVSSSSQEAFFVGSSSSTDAFVLSTAQASTTIYLGTQMPMGIKGVRVWEAE